MRRANLFWGVVLIIVGLLLYLQAQGIINNVFQYLWPLALIVLGIWFILSVYWKPAPSPEDTFSIPLGLAQSVSYKFSHGVGQLEIRGGAPMGQAIVGTNAAGINKESRMVGDRLEVSVEAGPSFIPFIGPGEGVWRFQIPQDLPVLLTVESGASALDIDLADVLATRLALKTGASSANVIMPARGVSLLDVESGAASVNIRVPAATAARIRVKNGVAAVDVDTNRFPLLDSGIYQSSTFNTSSDRTEINIESGPGKVTVK
ncbi:MAG TPA: DUF5668 domain-containing protein [Anaerolineales bacterium]|nr:DUF5668 domain-containing protein [Anaerolineales bacterium]